MGNDSGFRFLFGVAFVLIVGFFIMNAFLMVKCYQSNDPNSAACFMTSDRHDLNVRTNSR